MSHRFPRTLALSVSMLAGLVACHEGDAVTDPPSLTPTPTPTPAPSVQIAGTWAGHVDGGGWASPTEDFTATITQNAAAVRAEWVSRPYGPSVFEGGLSRGELRGHVYVQHASANGCSINSLEIKGPATEARIELSGTGLCRFDPDPYSLVLTRATARDSGRPL